VVVSRNPFVNQVSFFLTQHPATPEQIAQGSQSLRKSGQFLCNLRAGKHYWLAYVAIPS